MTLCIDILDYRLFWNFPIFSFFISLDFTRANDSISLCTSDFYSRSVSYKLSEKNVAALDRADVYLDDECVAKDGDVLKEDRLIRDRLGYPWRGGEMMQPWYIEKYYQEELKQRRNVKNVFHFVIEELPEGLELAVEAEEHTEVRLNGTLLKKEADFW